MIMNLIRWSLILSICIAFVPAEAKVYKIATIAPDGLSWLKKFRASTREIEQKTEGRVKFKIYPGGVQGDDQTVLRKMRIGQLHGGALAAGSLTKFYPDLQIYNLPLEFRDFEEVDYVRANLDDRIIQGLADAGLVSFGLIETGFAYVLSSQPVRSVDDLRKLKAWIPDNDPIAVRLIRSFGVTPIPLSLADVLASLQTGLINAVAIPPIVAIALQWHTQVKYLTEMPMVYIYSMLAMDRKAFMKMDAGDQIIVREILTSTFAEIDRDNRRDNVTAYQALLNQGIETVIPTDENRREWLSLAKTSIEDLVQVGEISTETYTILMTHLNSIRQQAGQAAQTGQ
jgi:TRAP-type C4-dicarboxylate transport system substrate-binding protein